MERLLLAMQSLHLPLQPLHPTDHAVERGERLGGILAGQRGIGGGFEGRNDVLVLPFDMLLDRLEVLPDDFVREAKEGLVLLNRKDLD